MKGKKIVRGAIVTGCCVAMVMSMGAGSAFAYQNQAFKAPTSETSVINADGTRNIKSLGQHGSAVVGEYCGMDQVANEMYATPGNGVSTSNYMYNPYFGIFGSSANENPDVYTANLFYNWYAESYNASLTEGATELTKSDNAMINFLPSKSKGSSFVTDDSDYNGTGISISLTNRPDVLTLNGTGFNNSETGNYVDQVKAVNENGTIAASDTYVGDANYNPISVVYDESTALTQVENMWRTAKAAAQVEQESAAAGIKAVTRYGDSLETAYKYELYTKGSVLYTLSKIADGTIKKKTVAYVKGISGDTVSLYSAPDNLTCREMMHHVECTTATCYNLANVLNPDLEITGNSQTVTCSVADLTKADVIILADPDNMAYNFGTAKSVGWLPSSVSWTKYATNTDGTSNTTGVGSAANNWGLDGTTSNRTDGKGHYKNEFYGPQSATNTMVSTIKEALYDLGTAKAKALAKKNILSCVQEGSSSSDGGSIECVTQHAMVNAFIYPEIASSLNQYAWYLNNIAHVKTSQTAKMVRILCQDMSLADGASLSDVSDYDASTSAAITATYVKGLRYYIANKAYIDKNYSWLTPTDDLAAQLPTVDAQTIVVKSATRTAKVAKKTGKLAAKKVFSFAVTGCKTSLTYTRTAATKAAKITVKVVSKTKITVTVPKNCKKGTYKITVKAPAKAGYYKASAAKTITIKVTK